ncbi:hypothetical protein H0H81_002868 [Sphagnurus paluster]|uniref:Uncharacterized protein n=1 Tax=Sphagnurus paluster TaxID=117069 RepID=A0A9P7GPB2_9AGAR|nr:hypothetical protein H0H81_002868 [Sphagnurus paluster]
MYAAEPSGNHVPRVVGTEEWLPKPWKELHALLATTNVIYEGVTSKVINPAPGIVVKYESNLLEEVLGTLYAREHLPSLRFDGVSLDQVIDKMTTTQLDHVADQLIAILSRTSAIQPKTLGSVTGGPHRNFFFPNYVAPKHAFATVGEFNDHITFAGCSCSSALRSSPNQFFAGSLEMPLSVSPMPTSFPQT